MFKSATIRLTGWYLLILMMLSVTFSIAIYQVASSELQKRLDHFQEKILDYPGNNLNRQVTLPPIISDSIQIQEMEAVSNNLSLQLLYVNLFVLIFGGLGCYFLSRRTLTPIEKAHESEVRFTSDASHELRTPLAVMRAEIEVALKDSNSTKKDYQEVLESNLEEVKRLTRLSETLLDLSRLNDKIKLHPIDLVAISKQQVELYTRIRKQIKMSAPKSKFIVKGNEVAISNLVKILLDNAIQYSPDNSQIKINISKIDGSAQFEIQNTGQGITEEKIPYIFERFYRADESRTNGPQKGYGLGLALAKSIIDVHKGKIFVTSIPNKTTSFIFTLPISSGKANIQK